MSNLEMLLKEAKRGNVEAHAALSQVYYSMGDYKNALVWQKSALRQGSELAKLCMGNLYMSGKVLKRNLEMALEWFTRAITCRDPELKMCMSKSIDHLFTEFRDEMYRLSEKTHSTEKIKSPRTLISRAFQ